MNSSVVEDTHFPFSSKAGNVTCIAKFPLLFAKGLRNETLSSLCHLIALGGTSSLSLTLDNHTALEAPLPLPTFALAPPLIPDGRGMPQSVATMRTSLTGSTFLLIIVGLWLWTMSMAFQLQHRHLQAAINPKNVRKFTGQGGLYSSMSNDHDVDDDDLMFSIGRTPADQGNEFLPRGEIYERKRVDHEVGRSLASTLVSSNILLGLTWQHAHSS
jgi:hypothetical protein